MRGASSVSCSTPCCGPRRRLLRGDAAALAGPALSHGAPGEEDAFSVLHGLYWLTVDVTQRAPLLLAVDDLHWADQPSLNFIAHLVRRLDGLPLLLVLTVREPRSATVQERAATASLAAETGVTVLRPSALGRGGVRRARARQRWAPTRHPRSSKPAASPPAATHCCCTRCWPASPPRASRARR